MKVREFTKLENKLELKTRDSGDRLAWFMHDGKAVTFTKRSHGNKDLPENLIRQQLKVSDSQFSGLISCSLKREDYVDILIKKGLIVPSNTAKPEEEK